MRFSIAAALFASAGFAAAQSSTGSACAAQIILDTCLSQTLAIAQSCVGNDWDCLCNQYSNVLTCYNNCPADSGRFGVSQQQTQYCAAAKAYGSAATMSATSASGSNSAAASATGSGSAAVAQSTMATTTVPGVASGSAGAGSSGSATGSAAAATSSGAAGNVVVPAGGAIALVLGVIGLL